MRVLVASTFIVAVVLAGACAPPCADPGGVRSDSRRVYFDDDLLFLDRGCGDLDAPILAGTRVCGGLRAALVDGGVTDVDVDHCFERSVAGAARGDGDGCFVVTGAGAVELVLAPRPCAVRRALSLPGDVDVVRFRAVAGDDVVARDAHDATVARALAERTPMLADGFKVVAFHAEPPLPDDFLPVYDEPLHLAADREVAFGVALLHVDGGTVAWNARDGALRAVDADGAPAATGIESRTAHHAQVVARADEASTIVLDVHGGTYPVVDVVGVDASAAASLALHVVWQGGGPPPHRVPAGLYAQVRDADGHLLRGAPVAWSTPDDLVGDVRRAPLGPSSERGEWVALLDVCRRPSARAGARRARVGAAVGDVSATVELAWLVPADVDAGVGALPVTAAVRAERFVPDERCPDAACACGAARDRPPNTPLAAALLAVAATRARRRRASAIVA